eukprot:5004443-Prymnesium_polylepis.2
MGVWGGAPAGCGAEPREEFFAVSRRNVLEFESRLRVIEVTRRPLSASEMQVGARFESLRRRTEKAHGLVPYEPFGQDGYSCLLLAALDQIREHGLAQLLPPGLGAHQLRDRVRRWLIDHGTLVIDDNWNGQEGAGRSELALLRDFGDDYWQFVHKPNADRWAHT